MAVLAEPDEATAISAKLAELGGTPESHEVSDTVVEEAAAATAEPAAPETPAA